MICATILAVVSSIALANIAIAHSDWPDGPHKHWFETLQRPDNHLHPQRQLDPKSLFCCGAADVVKTKFKVENGWDGWDARIPTIEAEFSKVEREVILF